MEIISVCSKIHAKRMSKLCRQKKKTFYIHGSFHRDGTGTGHSIRVKTFLQRGLKATLAEGCTRSCSYSLMCS